MRNKEKIVVREEENGAGYGGKGFPSFSYFFIEILGMRRREMGDERFRRKDE